ncbi:nitroreductase family protein [Salinisphaera aquimarina]|uniref:Nitroreductase family protein n=1 Tax=Salinisphaera aquimarina TaxID=2094031 RepID=A0ABV7EK95_9GAMM
MTKDDQSQPAHRGALADLVERRRSVRDYTPADVPAAALQRLLRNAQGDSQSDAGGWRNAPSAHALYPLELFVIARRVTDVEAGLYAIEREHGRLAKRLGTIEPGALLATSLADDEWLESAAVVIVVAADQQTARAHFADQQPDGRRGDRYVDIEAGAVLQTLHLSAEAEGLGGVIVMGFDESALARQLMLPAERAPVALFCLGVPAGEV